MDSMDIEPLCMGNVSMHRFCSCKALENPLEATFGTGMVSYTHSHKSNQNMWHQALDHLGSTSEDMLHGKPCEYGPQQHDSLVANQL